MRKILFIFTGFLLASSYSFAADTTDQVSLDLQARIQLQLARGKKLQKKLDEQGKKASILLNKAREFLKTGEGYQKAITPNKTAVKKEDEQAGSAEKEGFLRSKAELVKAIEQHNAAVVEKEQRARRVSGSPFARIRAHFSSPNRLWNKQAMPSIGQTEVVVTLDSPLPEVKKERTLKDILHTPVPVPVLTEATELPPMASPGTPPPPPMMVVKPAGDPPPEAMPSKSKRETAELAAEEETRAARQEEAATHMQRTARGFIARRRVAKMRKALADKSVLAEQKALIDQQTTTTDDTGLSAGHDSIKLYGGVGLGALGAAGLAKALYDLWRVYQARKTLHAAGLALRSQIAQERNAKIIRALFAGGLGTAALVGGGLLARDGWGAPAAA